MRDCPASNGRAAKQESKNLHVIMCLRFAPCGRGPESAGRERSTLFPGLPNSYDD